MKKVEVFLVDANNEVIQEHEYNVIKTVKDTHDFATLLVMDFDGDVAFVRAIKDYSVDPFRYIVRRKVLIPIISEDKDE